MDDFGEWERFMEFFDGCRSYEQAIKQYRKDRRKRLADDNSRELRKLERDYAKDAAGG